jgi:hypothetical protein
MNRNDYGFNEYLANEFRSAGPVERNCESDRIRRMNMAWLFNPEAEPHKAASRLSAMAAALARTLVKRFTSY